MVSSPPLSHDCYLFGFLLFKSLTFLLPFFLNSHFLGFNKVLMFRELLGAYRCRKLCKSLGE